MSTGIQGGAGSEATKGSCFLAPSRRSSGPFAYSSAVVAHRGGLWVPPSRVEELGRGRLGRGGSIYSAGHRGSPTFLVTGPHPGSVVSKPTELIDSRRVKVGLSLGLWGGGWGRMMLPNDGPS